ncbi:GDP-mannose pyrophosphorylase [Prauserella marina]|uniref:Mannose-1-phosphate guanylyltransferase n=1 Tax=Prauserella marina TaxID=530584 RepID=A0A222VKJ2_9PSEU|nr:NDP-sugar synthase [Prauserella marina]ASR34283.1 GDP-mannose pyrophosphorylase [Prauserella marina]PWV71943.1 mannose-1-phosphate guanylyltransferase [Prauserella marina]SDD91538.1 mannose-1-phosphate guanylyltransferase [Prauserella marina]
MTTHSGVDAVVLVGGKGTRLRPLTLSAPKPMLPTAGSPFLAHLLSRIRAAGITHVVLGTSYRAEVFEEYFGTGEAFGLDIDYVVEEQPLDTGGAIRNVADRLRAPDAVIFNGDVLSGTDLGALIGTHRSSGADVTLHLQRVADPSRFGSVPTDERGRVTAFLEKTPNPPTDQINAGCYVFRRSVVETIPAGRRVSVERETFPGLLAEGAHVQGFVDDSYWLDVGTPETFVKGSADLVRGIAPTSALEGPSGEVLRLDGARTSATAKVYGGTTLGARVRVGERAEVEGSVLFDDAEIGEDAVVEHSVIGKGTKVGAGAVLRGVVLGDDVEVGAGCELLNGARVWPGARLAAGSIRFSSDA